MIAAVIYYAPAGETPEIQSNAELARFVTEPSANTFPRLPVREGESVFIWFGAYQNAAAFEKERSSLTQVPRRTEVLRLEPTPRSLLR